MKFRSLLGLCLFAPICIAQTATSTLSGNTVITTVTDAAGDVYTVTTPLTVTQSIQVTTPSLGVVMAPPPTPPPPTAPTIPATAKSVSLISQGTWKAPVHDAGTPGTASGTNNYPVVGPLSNSDREFSMTYTAAGGVRWANSWANDTTATNFVLDAMVESPDWTHAADLELDTNAVLANGSTAILGTQCASQQKTWDITLLSGGSWHWVATNVPCNPLTWTPNLPHHIRIFGTISSTGMSVYEGVEFDDAYTPFANASGNTADALGWSKGTLLENLQIDGLGASGSATVYLDRFTLYRW